MCNGSTTDFDSVSSGSIPLASASLSLFRLAAMPPRLGRGFRGFESHRRDQFMPRSSNGRASVLHTEDGSSILSRGTSFRMRSAIFKIQLLIEK